VVATEAKEREGLLDGSPIMALECSASITPLWDGIIQGHTNEPCCVDKALAGVFPDIDQVGFVLDMVAMRINKKTVPTGPFRKMAFFIPIQTGEFILVGWPRWFR
jgi:hypothetical protein